MKKILFTIQWFPVSRSANVLCDVKIINELLKSGDYEIHCLTYQGWKQKLEEEVNGVKVHRFKRSFFWDVFMWARENEGTKRAKIIYFFNRVFLRLKQVMTIPFYPCYEPLLARKYARQAIKLHKIEKFDMVISEHNGFDTLYAGYSVKKKSKNIKFLPILWDPFSGKELAKYLPQRYAESRLIKKENKILSNADRIIAMKSSEEFHKQNSINKSFYNKYCFLDIPGIVQPQMSDNESRFIQKGKINVVFSGVLALPERDPEYIINLFNKTDRVLDINLIFLCVGNGKDKLYKLKNSFKGNLIINGYVDREEINRIYSNVDILLNIGGSNPVMVPSKIFEYMSYGSLIVSTYYIDGETSKNYLARYPLALCVDQREPIEANVEKLNFFINNKIGEKISFEKVRETFPCNTPEMYVDIIREVLER